MWKYKHMVLQLWFVKKPLLIKHIANTNNEISFSISYYKNLDLYPIVTEILYLKISTAARNIVSIFCQRRNYFLRNLIFSVILHYENLNLCYRAVLVKFLFKISIATLNILSIFWQKSFQLLMEDIPLFIQCYY